VILCAPRGKELPSDARDPKFPPQY
jgi:hypothetical protein